MNSHVQIVMAQPQDTDALSQVIARSFHPLAPSAWLIPDADDRRRIFPGYFRLLVEDAMRRGCVYTTAQRSAAALWLSVGEVREQAPAGYDQVLAAETGRWVDRFRLFDALLEKHHPTGRHDHLAILAVHPDHQHRGIGTALLDTHHRRLDESHQPTATYLEASDASTRQLYLGRGYTDFGDPIVLPSGACMYPMLRRSGSTTPRPAVPGPGSPSSRADGQAGNRHPATKTGANTSQQSVDDQPGTP